MPRSLLKPLRLAVTSSAMRFAALGLATSSLALAGCVDEVDDIEGAAWNGGDMASELDDDGGDDPQDPTAGSGDPSGGSGDDPTGGDPTGDDPTGDDPTGDEPTGGDPTGEDPTGDDPTGDDPTGDEPNADVPDNAYCDPVAGWSQEWLDLENEILVIVNQRRSEGANCGSSGSFGPAGPLTMAPGLRCAARVHSKDMGDRNFFDHNNPSGESPWDRIGQTGYQYSTAGENIAAGNATAAATMQQWMDSDGHCGNIMNPSFTEIGVGYSTGGQYGHLWTQVFATPG